MNALNFLRSYKYKNFTVVFLSILFAIYLSKDPEFHDWIIKFVRFKYLSAFLSGLFSVSTFTFSIGIVVLNTLHETMPIYQLVLIGALGSVVGDLIVFNFIRDKLGEEIKSLYDNFKHNIFYRILHLKESEYEIPGSGHLKAIVNSKYFSWTLPVIGALIIVSPFPDEAGISLLGLSKMSKTRFVFISYLLNSVGIFLVLGGIELLTA